MAGSKVDELESTFRNFDLEGNGELDFVSFSMALKSLYAELEDDDIQSIYDELDSEKSGSIKFIKFLASIRKQQVDGDPGQGVGEKTKEFITSIAGEVSEKKDLTDEEKEDVQKAIVVIKKGMMKKIKREDLFQFLRKKGMQDEIIDIAFKQAQATAFNPQERVRYFKNLYEEKSQEAANFQHENKKLKRELNKLKEEFEKTKKSLVTSVDVVISCYKKQNAQKCPEDVFEEIKNKLTAASGENAKRIEQLQGLLSSRRFVAAWLLLQTLSFKNELQDTALFLESFSPDEA